MNKLLIVGLGNPGTRYEGTRHNVGFALLDRLAKSQQSRFHPARLAEHLLLHYKQRPLHLIKPTTYMNASGLAVRYWLQKLALPLERLLVVTDDISLDIAQMRLKPQGGHGGHNGLRDICEKLGSKAYPRLRIGVGRHFAPGEQSHYVLGRFSPAEQGLLDPALALAQELVYAVAFQGLAQAMNRCNTSPEKRC